MSIAQTSETSESQACVKAKTKATSMYKGQTWDTPNFQPPAKPLTPPALPPFIPTDINDFCGLKISLDFDFRINYSSLINNANGVKR